MNNLKELYAKKAEAYKGMEEIRNQVAESEAGFNTDLREKFDRSEADYKKYDGDIKRLEAIEAEMAKEVNKYGNPAGETVDRKSEVNKAFSNYLRQTESHEDKMILRQNAAEQTITTTGGGYAIPEDFYGQVVERMDYIGPFQFGGDSGPGTVLRTQGGNPLPIPTTDDIANEGEVLAINTDATTNSTAVTFGTKQLDAIVTTTGIIQVPIQLLQDEGVNFEAFLAGLLGKRAGRIFNSQLTNGINAGEAEGFADKATEGKVAAADDAFTAQEIIDLYYSVDKAYQDAPGAGWMMHNQIAGEIRKLTVGTAADNFIWQPGLQQGQPDTLLGNPVFINNDLPSSIASGNRTVYFGDWDEFFIRIVRGADLVRYDERFMEKYQIGWGMFLRFDSVLVTPSAIKFLRQLTT